MSVAHGISTIRQSPSVELHDRLSISINASLAVTVDAIQLVGMSRSFRSYSKYSKHDWRCTVASLSSHLDSTRLGAHIAFGVSISWALIINGGLCIVIEVLAFLNCRLDSIRLGYGYAGQSHLMIK